MWPGSQWPVEARFGQCLRVTVGDTWTLRRGETVVGSIEVTDVDFPWLYGIWSPTEVFVEVKPLFDRELSLVDNDRDGEWENAYRLIWRAGIRLFDPAGSAVPEFLLHIDGSDAWFRWHDEPFQEGGVADA